MIDLTLKKKVIIFAIALVSLIISCLITGIWGLYQVQISKEQAEIAVKIHDSFNELRILFEQALMGPHDYLIHGNQDEKEIFLADYKKILDKKGELKSLIINHKGEKATQFNKVIARAEEQLLIIEEKLPLLRKKLLNIFSLQCPIPNQRAGSYMEKVDIFIRELQNELKKETDVLSELSDKAMKRIHIILMNVLTLLIIFGLVAVFLGIILSYFLIESINRPIGKLILATRKIKQGDLSIRANVETNDEIAELADSFNDMVDKLVDTQERISTILHGSGDAMCVIDMDFNMLQINKQMEKITGLSAASIKEAKCHEHFSSELCRTEDCTLKRILRGEEIVEVETIKESNDGRKIPVELIATPLKRRGEIIGVIESIRDITRRKQAEEALRQSELIKADRQRLFFVLDVLPALVCLQSSDYSIPFANRKFREIFGDPEGRQCYEILHGYKGPCEDCKLSSRDSDKKETKKWQLVTSKGRIYEMYDSLFIDIDSSLKVLELGIDITDRIRMEKARKNAERQLEEQRARAILSDRLRSLGEMATGMAHELNQPLLGVRGLAEHILIGFDRGWNISNDTIREKIQLIIKQTDRMTHVIEHARKFARGADDSNLIPVKVNEVIQSSMQLIEAQLRFRGLILHCEFAEGLPPVLANPFSLEEVILNLINNSRDAVMERIKNGTKDSPQIIVRTLKETKGQDCLVKIEVIDYGVGFPKELATKIFDPFFTTKGPDKGTGLGLSISKSIVEEFCGTLDIQSTLGLGTTVTIILPAMKQ